MADLYSSDAANQKSGVVIEVDTRLQVLIRATRRNKMSEAAYDIRESNIMKAQIWLGSRPIVNGRKEAQSFLSCRCWRAGRHGYYSSKLIQAQSGGTLQFHVTSLYPVLYQLEKRGCRLLLVVAFVACYLPARPASRLDPLTAPREG